MNARGEDPNVPEEPGVPEESGAPDESGVPEESGAGVNGDADGPDAPAMDEAALRQLMHQTVQGLEPSPASLDHLRRAVPRRRARKRQVLAGAAAAVVLGGAAIPAMLHADLMPGGDDKPMHAASHSETPGPDGEHGHNGGEDHENSHKGKESGGQDGEESGGSDAPSPTAGGDTEGPGPTDTLASAPTCAGDQLGQGTADVGTPDGEGRIYGSFKVTNTSAEPCTVEGEGIVGVNAQGRASSSNLQVVDHTPGDGTGLPDPGMAAEELVLKPGAAYVVKFAWVPREGRGPSGCSTATTPPPGGGGPTDGGEGTPDPGDGAAEGGEGNADTGTGDDGSGSPGGASSGPGSDNGGGGGPGGASVSVSHTPDPGASAAASTVLPGACAGTVYRTGVLASP